MLSSDDMRFLDLLQKWQEGNFTRSDEQELQALTRADDFRREAWEGFQMHPEEDHSARLAALRARIQPGKAVRRVLLPPITAVAAVLVLLLAAIWFFRSPDPQPEDVIAQNETPTVQNQSMSDASPPVEVVPGAPENLKSGDASKAVQPQPRALDRVSEMEPERKADAENSVVGAMQAPAGPPPVVSSPARDDVAERSKDLAVEETDVQKEQQSYVGDKKAKTAPAKTEKPSPVTTRSQGAPGNVMQDVDYELAALQDYLRRNARLPEAARQNNVSGYVSVSFRLLKNDTPVDFKIIRSLGYGCDEEAIRLLREYNFRDFTQERLTVEVPFVR